MQYIRICRILAVVLSLILLAIVVPSTLVLAVGEEDIYLNPGEGRIDQKIIITGEGFKLSTEPGDKGAIIYFGKDAADLGQLIGYDPADLDNEDDVDTYKRVKTIEIDEGGEFSSHFDVPATLSDGIDDEAVSSGTYYVYVTYYYKSTDVEAHGIEAVAEFTVITGDITLDVDKGVVGTEVEITGEGFDAHEDITVEYDGGEVDIESGDDATDIDGGFELTILVPESTAGDHTITVIGDDSSTAAEAEFTVEEKITISPASGVVGDTITVSGTGFGRRVDFSIFFDDVEAIASETTGSDGSFKVTFAALVRGPASYDVEAEDGDGNADKVKFTIAPVWTIPNAVSLSSTSGYVGSEVVVSGTGFQADQPISISFGEELAKTASTDSYGALTASFTVPVRIAGTYKVVVSDGTNMIEADFSIVTSASIDPETSAASPGYIGTELTVSGVGFTVGRTVIITYDDNQVTTAIVDADGTFSATFAAPPSTSGAHTVTATVDGVTNPFTFIMELTPPPTPKPLNPEMGIKAESEAYFNWEDVTDPSGVTYTLQIATDENFSQGSIVLEKTGLTQSEYTIAREARLKSVSKDAPYYWHVKAVDGASNESQWTGTGSFYVGVSLALPQPIIYTLFGIGILLFGLFGFWLGRKTAYY